MKFPEKARIKGDPGQGGMFRFIHNKQEFQVIASNGYGWDHVSVILRDVGTADTVRCPTWEEMCFVKSLFWDEEEEVVQYHPRKSEYKDTHPHCLHLWRPNGILTQLPRPPVIMV